MDKIYYKDEAYIKGGGGNLERIDISQSDYNALSLQEKEDSTKIYFIENTNHLYYMNIVYNGVFPITLESDNTVVQSSSQGVTLESGYHYLMTTIYSGGTFTNASIEAGSQRVFNQDGYDRTIYIISTSATNVSYSRSGSLDTNKFIKFRIKRNGQYADDLRFTNEPQSTWNNSSNPTLTLEAGNYYMITYKAYQAPNLTGATPICYTYIGDQNSNKSISMIIRADSDQVTIADYTAASFYYQKLTY